MTRKQIAAILASAFLVALISLALVACKGGDKDSTPTDFPRTTCKPAQPVVPSTPSDVPAGLQEYQSPGRGYRIRFPSDWKVQPNAIAVQNIAGDAFFTTAPSGKVKPNLAVSCETIPIGSTSGDFIDAKRQVILRVLGDLPDIEKTLTVDGYEAASIRYQFQQQTTPEPIKIEKVEVFFANDMGGWTIGLTAPQGTIDTYRSIFDAFVESFRGS